MYNIKVSSTVLYPYRNTSFIILYTESVTSKPSDRPLCTHAVVSDIDIEITFFRSENFSSLSSFVRCPSHLRLAEKYAWQQDEHVYSEASCLSVLLLIHLKKPLSINRIIHNGCH